MMLRLLDIILVLTIAGSFVVAGLDHFDIWKLRSHTTSVRISDTDEQQDSAEPNSKAVTEAGIRPALAPKGMNEFKEAETDVRSAQPEQGGAARRAGREPIAAAGTEDTLSSEPNREPKGGASTPLQEPTIADKFAMSPETTEGGQAGTKSVSVSETDRSLKEETARYYVQLISLSSREAADVAVTQLAIEFSDILEGRDLSVYKSDSSGRTQFKVRAGPFRTRPDGRHVCDQVERRGGNCFVVKVEPTSQVGNNNARQAPVDEGETETELSQVFITTTRVNYRDGPSRTASKHGVLPEETVVQVLFNDTDWARVRLQSGQEAYVARAFIRPLERP